MAPMSVSHKLLPHPGNSQAENVDIVFEGVWKKDIQLGITFTVQSEAAQVLYPPTGPAMRRDGLWKETCFEFFILARDGKYIELNLSPSESWAAYCFSNYRAGMSVLNGISLHVSTAMQSTEQLSVSTHLDFHPVIDVLGPVESLSFSPTAVIQKRDGNFCYYGLRFPRGNPDFHHRDGFTSYVDFFKEQAPGS